MPMTYQYPNGRTGLLVNVPVSKNKHLFNKYAKRSPWIEHILKHIQKDDPFDAVYWLTDYLHSYSKEAFEKVCEMNGYFKLKKLDTIQTAAMRTESNASLTQYCIILCHLQIGLGYNVTVPESNIKNCVEPIFSIVKPNYGVYMKYPPNPSGLPALPDHIKKPEEINYWVSNPTTILAELIQQKISSMNADNYTTFGYPKVNLVLGSNHGAGSSKFLFWANLISPKEIQQLDNIESCSIIFQFANITCKKESSEVISLANKEINKSIHDF